MDSNSETEVKVTLVIPYYENPFMLRFQQSIWEKYPQEVLDQLEIIIVDDASPKNFAANHLKKGAPYDFSLYRIKKDIPWNWEAARNIGAAESKYPYLFLTDIDHVVPAETLQWLMFSGYRFRDFHYYTFDRVDAPANTPYKNHPNTYFMKKSLYWDKIGGYDEEFNIKTGGIYGMDGPFRRWLDKKTDGCVHLCGCQIIRYPREVITDAASPLPRKKGRNENDLAWARKRAKTKLRKNEKPMVLKFEYHRVK